MKPVLAALAFTALLLAACDSMSSQPPYITRAAAQLSLNAADINATDSIKITSTGGTPVISKDSTVITLTDSTRITLTDSTVTFSTDTTAIVLANGFEISLGIQLSEPVDAGYLTIDSDSSVAYQEGTALQKVEVQGGATDVQATVPLAEWRAATMVRLYDGEYLIASETLPALTGISIEH